MEEIQQESRGNIKPAIMADGCERTTPINMEISSSQPECLLMVLADSGQQETHQSPRKPRMHKVPAILRDIKKNKEHFDPMVVTFGPYHHGNPKLAMLEKLKITIAKQLVMGRDLKDFYKFDEVAHDARECYDEESIARFSNAEFISMMFLDSCFLLHFIDCLMKNKLEDTKMHNYQIAFVIRDIFLLENQIPFVVLQALMSLNIPGNDGEEVVHKFIKMQSILYYRHSMEKRDHPPHILDLLRNELVGTVLQPKSPQTSGSLYTWYTFRSVTELRAGRIKFNKGNSSSLKDVRFNNLNGDLFLPPIVGDDLTMTMLLNFAAYEACPDFPNDLTVNSYICFMDGLIDDAEDVKELRSKGILLNLVRNDEEVADHFNGLATNLVPNPNEYRDVYCSIEMYYNQWRNVIARTSCMTNLREKYFRNPWTVIALVATALALLLTMVQTYYTVFPRNNNNKDSSKKP
ncbi:UPF0481 protein At3g47200-like [Telopea speciosissima]|uniref:UPF0481 protein At3g47200-like n=1 Tax=Telopea speciosissima TaxID=54955 RepID=UPI001CC35E1B|nr:UPF0481 protein At3g47200-like [Telopea speciosissima]